MGERPAMIGDQMLWWIMNDRGSIHNFSETPPVGLEDVLLRLTVLEELIDRDTDVDRDSAKQGGRDVSTFVEGHGGCASVLVAKLFVRTLLACLMESQATKDPNYFLRL